MLCLLTSTSSLAPPHLFPLGLLLHLASSQERLNHDADILASKIFHMPMSLLHCSLHVVTNATAIYSIKSELFWTVVAPIPIISLLQRKVCEARRPNKGHLFTARVRCCC